MDEQEQDNLQSLSTWLKINNLTEPEVFEELTTHNITVSTILSSEIIDIRDFCKECKFSATIKLKLIAAFNRSISKLSKNNRVLSNIEMIPFTNNVNECLLKTSSAINDEKKIEKKEVEKKKDEENKNNEIKGLNNLKITNVRIADFSHPLIKPSQSPDCLGLDMEGEQNVLMPCGHSFSPSGLFAFIQSQLAYCQVPIKCPISDCKTEWSFSIMQCASGMSIEEALEYHTWSEKLLYVDEKYYKQCPVCKIGRYNGQNSNKVRCPNTQCKSSYVCFKCLNPWHPSYDCDDWKEQNDCLQNCPEVLIGNLSIKAPQTRACPHCQKLLQYEKDCKHISCPFCKHQFCFICLGDWKRDKCPVGNYTVACQPHPRQRLPLTVTESTN